MRRDVAGWLLFWAAAGTLFYVAEQQGWPLCGATRHLFNASTPEGRFLMGATYATGATALGAHLMKRIPSET